MPDFALGDSALKIKYNRVEVIEMAEIAVSNISKSFGLDEIFSDVSFNIEKNDKIGVVGVNGAGKTTLFNILTEKIKADSGNIYIRNHLKIGYMLQNVNIQTDKTIFEYMEEAFTHVFLIQEGLEDLERQLSEAKDEDQIKQLTTRYHNLLEKLEDAGGHYYDSQIEGVLKGLGFSADRFYEKVNHLSGGEKSRLSLAKLMLSDADVLLLDEPTNHLDMAAIDFVEQYLRDSRKIVLLISHDRFFLDRVVKRIFLLEKKRLYVYDTNYSDFMAQRQKDKLIEQRAYENQQKEIARQEEIIARFASAGKALRKRGIAQSRSRQKLLDKMKRIEKPDNYDQTMALHFKPSRESGEDVLEAKDLSMAFGEHVLFKDVNFNIYKGEKIGLIGANGTGKTTLFKMILNKLKPDSGQIDLGVGVFPEYFDQQQANLSLDKTVIDEIWDDYPDLTHYDIRAMLARFLFIGDDIFKTIDQLSGGERARITLLKLMLSSSNFLLMDEPTNHLDIDSKEVLEEALNAYEATAFIISHDRYFLNKVVDRIFVLKDQTLESFEGNYDYYVMKMLERQEEQVVEQEINKTQQEKQYKKNKENQKLARQRKAAIRNLENEIEDLEADIEVCNNDFMKPEIYEDHEKSFELQQKIFKLKEKKEKAYQQWADLLEEEMGDF